MPDSGGGPPRHDPPQGEPSDVPPESPRGAGVPPESLRGGDAPPEPPPDARVPEAPAGFDPLEPDGPPVPPPIRRRRRRRQVTLGVVAVLVLVAVPATLAGIGVFGDAGERVAAPDDPPAGDQPDPGDPPDRDDDPDGDGTAEGTPGDPPADPDVVAPDLDALDGLDAVFGELLTDIDASERTMIAFQDEVAELLAESDGTDPQQLLTEVIEAAVEGRDALEVIRERLEPPLDEPEPEAVREAYVVHLDSWAGYLDAITDDPSVLGSDGWRLDINTTADRFARTLEQQLPDGADAEVEQFAEGILERGFRREGEADV